MAPHPQPLSGPSNASRKKETVVFSTLDNPPRANLLPPAALLSLLCLAFLCLVFVCFRHTEWIVARRKIWEVTKEQAIKLSDQFAEFKFNRQRRIKLIDNDEEDERTTLGRSIVPSNTDPLQSLNLSPHHQLQSHLLELARQGDDHEEEEEDEEDNEVLNP